MQDLKQLMNAGAFEEAWAALLDQARTVNDFPDIMKLCRHHQRLCREAPRTDAQKVIKVALLGGATTELMEAPLALCLDATAGLGCRLHRADYNTFAQEMLDPDSRTARFRPDLAVVSVTAANVPSWPATGDARDAVAARASEVVRYFLGLCERLHASTGCEIVLDNFHAPLTRAAGNLSARLPCSPANFLRRVNVELADEAPAYVHVNDVEYLAARHGLARWFDTRYWLQAKQPVSFDCLVPYVRNVARVIGAIYGRSAKCVALDLDNTLWGGVIGDDGLDGIKLGEGNPIGEAHKAFQEYLKQLRQRGVILAVCSKNDEVNALAPFEKHADMVLRRSDIACFKANWKGKPDNLREIAAELNIGLDAIVFVDDNPAERAHVRQRVPQVKVVELPADPAGYAQALDEAALFEIAALSAEDRQRTEQYAANAARQQMMKESAADYAGYLRTLNQRATVAPFLDSDLDRITQLTNKSNQFNLTTRRVTRSEVEQMMTSPDTLTATVRLVDCFGDNGLISVFAASRRHDRDADELAIDVWLMSCRVLKRGVEQLLLNHAVERARAMGITALRGLYIPTAKNGLVKDHYRSLGFAQVGDADADADGTTHWRLDVATFKPFDVAITIVADDADSAVTSGVATEAD
jgi:FkbH-like protein